MEYNMPTKIVFGRGSIERIGTLIDPLKPKRVMIVTGRKSMKKLGITDRITNEILDGYDVFVWDNVEPNPSTETVKKGVEASVDADVVIAIGGGSVIDTAKCIAADISFVAVPTTAGTGSEVTRWATVWDYKKKKKVSLSDHKMYADIAVIDPELTLSMPKSVTASTGMDALAQGIESYWSRNHNMISDAFAENAVRLAFNNIKKAYDDPENYLFRENMSLAALFSGLAINGTKTTAAHSLSYPMTMRFGVPHGHACILTIPSFMVFNERASPERLNSIAGWLGAESVKHAAKRITSLMQDIDLETKLDMLGIDESGIEHIVRNGFDPDRIRYNPRDVTEVDARSILKSIL